MLLPASKHQLLPWPTHRPVGHLKNHLRKGQEISPPLLQAERQRPRRVLQNNRQQSVDHCRQTSEGGAPPQGAPVESFVSMRGTQSRASSA